MVTKIEKGIGIVCRCLFMICLRNVISSDQAHEIAKVYYENKDRITTLICQCEHGQSRSAAVASAILEFKSRRGIQIFADDRYYPNKVVFRRVLEALKDQIPVYEYS